MSNENKLKEMVANIEKLIVDAECFAEENGINFDVNPGMGYGSISYDASWSSSWSSSND